MKAIWQKKKWTLSLSQRLCVFVVFDCKEADPKQSSPLFNLLTYFWHSSQRFTVSQCRVCVFAVTWQLRRLLPRLFSTAQWMDIPCSTHDRSLVRSKVADSASVLSPIADSVGLLSFRRRQTGFILVKENISTDSLIGRPTLRSMNSIMSCWGCWKENDASIISMNGASSSYEGLLVALLT